MALSYLLIMVQESTRSFLTSGGSRCSTTVRCYSISPFLGLGADHCRLKVNNYWINQGAPNKDFWAHEVREEKAYMIF